ncbi:MAG: porin family protein [Cyanothece sp. SIO1E1]|nr:porin family protein [Cyanothece sp. SIO1E1]
MISNSPNRSPHSSLFPPHVNPIALRPILAYICINKTTKIIHLKGEAKSPKTKCLLPPKTQMIMKKLCFLILFAASLLATSQTNAQTITSGNPNFSKGQWDVNAGIGLIRTFYGSHRGVVPPVSVSAELGVTDNISVGGYIGYTSTKDRFGFLDDFDVVKYSFVIIGARGSYHFNVWDKMDTYGGLMLGYAVASAKWDSTNPYLNDASFAASGLSLSAYIGGRYDINENIGAFAEIGYGISVLTIGATMKF